MSLKKCPDSPNCVSSQSDESSHKVSPIAYQGDAKQALAKIKQLILAMPRTRLQSEDAQSLRVEFTSSIFKFVDDVDVLLDSQQQLIHIRSASRTGYWDFGVNRKRVEQIRALFHSATESN